jgi:hypothetical protein
MNFKSLAERLRKRGPQGMAGYLTGMRGILELYPENAEQDRPPYEGMKAEATSEELELAQVELNTRGLSL